jgi:hypothetical protein
MKPKNTWGCIIPPPTTQCGSNHRACMRWFVRLAHEYYNYFHKIEKVQFD